MELIFSGGGIKFEAGNAGHTAGCTEDGKEGHTAGWIPIGGGHTDGIP